MSKSFWLSKTFWVNLLAIMAIMAQYLTGNEVFDAEAQVIILGMINLALRVFTNQPLKW